MTETAAKPCPICDRPSADDYRPFCSKRCANVDLNRWLAEGYRVPVTEAEDEIWDDSPTPPTADPESD